MSPMLKLDKHDHWYSAIGRFLMNFGFLHFLVLEFLEHHLSDDDYVRLKGQHFQDQVGKVRSILLNPCVQSSDSRRLQALFDRIETIRKMRNHLAHGCLLFKVHPDSGEVTLGPALITELDGTDIGDYRHLTFANISQSDQELTGCIEEFKALCPGWTTWTHSSQG